MTQYELIKKLINHDWYFEHSDDYSVWKNGNDHITNIVRFLASANFDDEKLDNLMNATIRKVNPFDDDPTTIAIWSARFDYLRRRVRTEIELKKEYMRQQYGV